jgi:Sensors of blue-light using FAD
MTEIDRAVRSPMPLHRVVIYISRPAEAVTLDEVRALIFEARSFNAINGIFGLLTYDRRGFLQAVEGADDAIDELLEKIRRDPRHHEMQLLFDASFTTLQFASFHDFLLSGERLASLSLLPHATLARLSGDVAGALGQGFARL